MITLIRILRFVVIGILIYVLYKLIWKGKSAGAGEKERKAKPSKALEEMKQDPICGIFIPESQAIQYNWNKEIYYFCSEECKRKFQKLKQ
jgi:uncharacterized protein